LKIKTDKAVFSDSTSQRVSTKPEKLLIKYGIWKSPLVALCYQSFILN